MKAAKRNKVNLWGHVIEYEEAPPDSKIAAISATIDTRLAAFDHYKDVLLKLLHDAYKRGPKSKPFDRDKTWSDVRHFAWALSLRDSAKREQLTMPPRARIERLHRFADTLGRARYEIDQAIKDGVGEELCAVRWKRKGKGSAVQQQGSPFTETELNEVIEKLAALKTAALSAIKEIPITDGRPGGEGILPFGHIVILGSLYLNNTEVRAGAGPGPFARFVVKFLQALGHRNVVANSVIEAIKDARKQMPLVANIMHESPFNLGGKTPRISDK